MWTSWSQMGPKMKIEKIEMLNWRPFYGSQSLDLDTTAKSPYVWIHGDNMRGKTSILNAVKWCLYGRTEDSGVRRPRHLNLNKRAARAGQFNMSVKLYMEHEKRTYELERQAQWRAAPIDDSAGEENLHLRVDGQIVSAEDAAKAIQSLLHEDISQFYLFDGEMIREYQERLTSERDAEFVRGAIERIVGLPAVRRGADDLAHLADLAQSEVQKRLRKEKAYEKLSDELDLIEDNLNAAKRDAAELEEQRENIDSEIATLEGRLQQYDGIRERLVQRDQWRDQMVSHRVDRADLVARLQDGIRDRWWFAAFDRIRMRRQELDADYERRVEAMAQRRLIEDRIAELKKSVKGKSCPLCGQPITADHKAHVDKQIEKLEGRLGDDEMIQGQADEALRVNLMGVSDPLTAQLFEWSRNIATLDVKIAQLETRTAEIDAEIREGDQAQAADLQQKIDRFKDRLRDVRAKLEEANQRRDAAESERREKRKKIPELPGGDRPRRRLDILTALASTLDEAVASFRDEVRSDVHLATNDLFRRFISEPDFTGTEIDAAYLVTILDKDKSPVQPSMAAAQVAALSFIGGLKKTAVREGPLMIDTPLARFDLRHRDRLVAEMSALGSQVILLLQPGEFDRERYWEAIGSKVAREYTLERVSDQESRIVPGFAQEALSR